MHVEEADQSLFSTQVEAFSGFVNIIVAIYLLRRIRLEKKRVPNSPIRHVFLRSITLAMWSMGLSAIFSFLRCMEHIEVIAGDSSLWTSSFLSVDCDKNGICPMCLAMDISERFCSTFVGCIRLIVFLRAIAENFYHTHFLSVANKTMNILQLSILFFETVSLAVVIIFLNSGITTILNQPYHICETISNNQLAIAYSIRGMIDMIILLSLVYIFLKKSYQLMHINEIRYSKLFKAQVIETLQQYTNFFESVQFGDRENNLTNLQNTSFQTNMTQTPKPVASSELPQQQSELQLDDTINFSNQSTQEQEQLPEDLSEKQLQEQESKDGTTQESKHDKHPAVRASSFVTQAALDGDESDRRLVQLSLPPPCISKLVLVMIRHTMILLVWMLLYLVRSFIHTIIPHSSRLSNIFELCGNLVFYMLYPVGDSAFECLFLALTRKIFLRWYDKYIDKRNSEISHLAQNESKFFEIQKISRSNSIMKSKKSSAAQPIRMSIDNTNTENPKENYQSDETNHDVIQINRHGTISLEIISQSSDLISRSPFDIQQNELLMIPPLDSDSNMPSPNRISNANQNMF